VPIGYAIPGRTLERIDLFDPAYRTHVGLVTGASGGGKTVFVNTMLMRSLARGAQGMIIDRSSSEDAESGIREAGHYETLVDLAPGAQKLHFGADHHDAVLCPWDVGDPAKVSSEKVRFLLALHTLLIGDPARDSDERELSGEDRSLLERGIQRVYDVAADTSERPCESLLRRELLELARREEDPANEDGDPQIASKFRALAARLHTYCKGGTHAWLCDEKTTITEDAPLLLCDLAGLGDELAGPVMLTLVDHMGRAMQRRRSRFRHGGGSEAGPWAGKAFLVIDECWAQLSSRAAGRWLNEWARRTRHMSCALLAVTQQLEDFNNEQGHALVSQSVLRVYFRTSRLSLGYIREASGLDDQDLETITRELQTQKGDFSEAYLVSEAHGRARVRIYLSDMEYWAVSSDPERDQPIRHLALQQAGDPWGALRLLVDPVWHREQANALTKAAYSDANGNGAAPMRADELSDEG
jgi:type IV secretory pathway VirB4 component